MPELPEVEIVKRSLENKVKNKKIRKVIITNRNLRFKIHRKFENILKGKFIVGYIGTIGMSQGLDTILTTCHWHLLKKV